MHRTIIRHTAGENISLWSHSPLASMGFNAWKRDRDKISCPMCPKTNYSNKENSLFSQTIWLILKRSSDFCLKPREHFHQMKSKIYFVPTICPLKKEKVKRLLQKMFIFKSHFVFLCGDLKEDFLKCQSNSAFFMLFRFMWWKQTPGKQHTLAL